MIQSDSDLPAITKANLRKVGIEINDALAVHWVERGHMLIAAHLTRYAMFERHIERLRDEEDGA